MNTNINLFSGGDDNKRKNLERTGRVGGNARYSANQYELKENQIMVPKPVANPNSLSIKLRLD
jgi:hypothetical protein